VPSTPAGIEAIRTLIGEGISINVTLMFNRKHYRDVAMAYVEGLEALAEKGGDLSKVHSVASFFVSRVDTLIDKELDAKALRPRVRRRTPCWPCAARPVSRTAGRVPGLPRDLRGVKLRASRPRAPGPAPALGVDGH
jgi:hypothetical protein